MNLSYCKSIDQILASQNIDCDAIFLQDETMQYALLYQSKAFKLFTDSLITEVCKYFGKEYIIQKLPHIITNDTAQIQQFTNILSIANTSYTLASIIKYISDYLYAKHRANKLNSPRYERFYNAKSNSYIWLNTELLNSDFDDVLQIKLDCKEIGGIYMNRKLNRQLAIYLDAFTNSWKFTNRNVIWNST